ncbi:hypothetical protein HYU13_02585 [Candidatus Woesearchaeota archaeon]|nr:hypothetical protein [Candidatus Woesearchaeota archaeon]
MAGKAKRVFTSVRVIILIVALAFSLISISPNPFREGVAIRSVLANSSANLAGMQSPKPSLQPMAREVIRAINNVDIKDVDDFEAALSRARLNSSLLVKTNKQLYRLVPKEKIKVIELNETEMREVQELNEVEEEINGTMAKVNKTIFVKKLLPKTVEVSEGIEDFGLRVYDAPTSNLRKGLDLEGGTRVLLEPEKQISRNDMDNLIAVMTERLNVYGLSDIIVRSANDLSGKQYIVAEIAGASQEEVRDLIAKQGKFEAKIAGEPVFRGGEDITFVCRTPDCAGLDPDRGCGQDSGQWYCNFRFSIILSQEAAMLQGQATGKLAVVNEGRQQYLNESIFLYLDDREVDRLRIGAELKGSQETNIQISGSGIGISQQEAAINALQNMKRLQTVLITGSLPFKLNIVKIDTISPFLGREFLKNSLFAGLMAALAVSFVIGARYKRIKIVLPIVATIVSEIIILLGIASLIGWNLDLAGIAGIIIAIGTGVDHQIVITDEVLRGQVSRFINWKEKIKMAFFIIMGAFFTTVAAMIPLLFAGAGLLKGFALISIIGVSLGVFITRPAFARIIEVILED